MPPADDVHGLQIALATALRERDTEREFRGAAEAAFGEQLARTEAAEKERDTARDELHHVDTRLGEMCARWTEARAQINAAKYMVEKARDCERAEKERDSYRTALTEVNDLLLSVPPGEDWRAVVRKKVVVALFGEAAWKEK